MEVFSGFSQVIESDGSRMSVATALELINDKLQGILWDQEAEFDLETRAAVAWYDQYDWQTGRLRAGRADRHGQEHVDPPASDRRHHVVQGRGHPAVAGRRDSCCGVRRPVRAPDRVGYCAAGVRPAGEGTREDAVRLLASVRSQVQLDAIVDLARLMFTIGEKRKRTDDQLRFNNLVTEWPELAKSAREYAAQHASVQPTLDEVMGHGG